MDKKKSIKKQLKEFKNDLSNVISVKKMIFFGSRATGKFRKDSDIDLIIVSQKFKGIKFRKRFTKMYDFWNLDYPVDFLCYTPEEFNKLKEQTGIIQQAVKEGIEL